MHLHSILSRVTSYNVSSIRCFLPRNVTKSSAISAKQGIYCSIAEGFRILSCTGFLTLDHLSPFLGR